LVSLGKIEVCVHYKDTIAEWLYFVKYIIIRYRLIASGELAICGSRADNKYTTRFFFKEDAMKVRADSAFLASALYTVALLPLVQPALQNYYAGNDRESLARLDAGFRVAAQMAHVFGVACLAIILVGLIVLWTGYVERSRSAWLVMFVIAFAWAFPLFISPLFRAKMVSTISEWLYTAIHEPGVSRTATEYAVSFSLMVIALLLPIRSFFSREIDERASHRP
jgi:hypothetical protein